MRSFEASLRKKIKNRSARIGVIGVGYVGLPLAVEFAGAGFHVIGFDADPGKVKTLNEGKSYVGDVSSRAVKRLLKNGRFICTTNNTRLSDCDCILICVPTPLNKVKEPDISFVLDATRVVKRFARSGQLIVLESTTYPGTTEEIVKAELDSDGFRVGVHYFLCFSPERIDPGNREYPLRKIPKVVGGVSKSCLRLGSELYRSIIREVMPVSSPRVAEMAKLLENTFRVVNIGLVNELAPVAERLNINLWEAIEAAKTKPYGFMPFYPGPGIGGHCIGIDPLYLAWKAKLAGSELRFVALASRINAAMPHYVVERILYLLNSAGKTIRESKILILGVSYKKDVTDIRESPALEIITELKSLGAAVQYHDPFVNELKLETVRLKSIPLSAHAVKRQDIVVLVTPHSRVNYALVSQHANLIFDTRNEFDRFKPRNKNITTL